MTKDSSIIELYVRFSKVDKIEDSKLCHVTITELTEYHEAI